MSVLSIVGKLLSGGVIDQIVGLVDSYQDKKLTKEQLQFEIRTLAERQAHDIDLAQIELNKAEANGNWFQRGWRPATGWVCVLGFAMNFLIAPLGTFIAGLAGSDVILPTVDLSTMMPVLLGMLGLGSLRTVEKIKSSHDK
jgi:hypothetical protein